MIQNVTRARTLINLMMLYYLLLTVVPDIMFFRFGVGYGIYRTVLSLVPLVAMVTLLESASKGDKKALRNLNFFIGLGVVFGVYSIISNRKDIVVNIIIAILTLSYLCQLIYLTFSKDMRSLLKYTKDRNSLKWLWTWNGKCIGYQEENYLWSYSGRNIGMFYGNEIYSPEGNYIGELHSNGRLVLDKSKKSNSKDSYEQLAERDTIEKVDDTTALKMYLNYEEFSTLHEN